MVTAIGGRNSVRRHLAVLVTANLVVVLVVGVCGIIGVLRAHDSVHYLTRQVEPTVAANAAAFQDLTDSETQIRGWILSGDPSLLDEYQASVKRFRADETRLERLKSIDPQVGRLVEDFRRTTDAWFTSYAEPRLTQGIGAKAFDPEVFHRGLILFREVRTANAAVTARLEFLSDRSARSADQLKSSIIVILSAIVLAGAVLGGFVGSRFRRRVTGPLSDLEETAHRLAAGQHDARAPVAGPLEVVGVALAVNKMADENARARAIEARVVEQLRELDSAKSDFVSNVSHELRTPLTSILGYVELLEDELADNAGGSEPGLIAAAKRNALRLGALIDDLLALTRTEDRSTDLQRVDLVPLTQSVVTDMRVASTRQGVEVGLTTPVGPVPVLADPGQIARVVTNLVSNAVKFSLGASDVEVSITIEGGDAVITVADHGIGIPSSEMDHLGSRFYRASNAVGMGITGTGLGLRIVQAIVENHDGSIDLHSEQGVGTTARVRLPLQARFRTASTGPELPADRDRTDLRNGLTVGPEVG